MPFLMAPAGRSCTVREPPTTDPNRYSGPVAAAGSSCQPQPMTRRGLLSLMPLVVAGMVAMSVGEFRRPQTLSEQPRPSMSDCRGTNAVGLGPVHLRMERADGSSTGWFPLGGIGSLQLDAVYQGGTIRDGLGRTRINC